MSILSVIAGLFSSGTSVTTELTVIENVVLNGLKTIDALITTGATVESTVVTEINVLETKLEAAITAAEKEGSSLIADLKKIIGEAEAWVAARVISVAPTAEVGANGKVSVAAIHIS